MRCANIYGPVRSLTRDISSMSGAAIADGDKPANLIAIRAGVRRRESADVPVRRRRRRRSRRLRIFHNYPCEIAVL